MTFDTLEMNGTSEISGISGISEWLDVYFIFVLQWEACLVDVGEVVP